MQQHLNRAWEVYEPRVRQHGPSGISAAPQPPHVAEDLMMYRSQRLSVVFAPFKKPESIMRALETAAVLFVGLTPGR